MKRLSRNELQSRNGKDNNALQGLSNFSNELCDIINDTHEKTCIGAFYADREKPGSPLPEEQYKYLNMLRNQLLLAIKHLI